jgi:hypothetical protein
MAIIAPDLPRRLFVLMSLKLQVNSAAFQTYLASRRQPMRRQEGGAAQRCHVNDGAID